jgi:hypothetical protein
MFSPNFRMQNGKSLDSMIVAGMDIPLKYPFQYLIQTWVSYYKYGEPSHRNDLHDVR